MLSSKKGKPAGITSTTTNVSSSGIDKTPVKSTAKHGDREFKTPPPASNLPELKVNSSNCDEFEFSFTKENSNGLPQLSAQSSIKSRSSSNSSLGSPGLSSRRKNLTISDFTIDRPLGKGAFGQVYLVRKKDTERKYAMKTIKKIDMVKFQLIEATILEKTILLRSSHPFVV